jgi:hypothetical protein
VNTIDIYLAEEKIASENFTGNFYIIKDLKTNKLFWKADSEQYPSNDTGMFQIWIQRANRAASISFILPDWQLAIDGVSLEQSFYSDVNISGRIVELKYNNYRFVCSCPHRPSTR